MANQQARMRNIGISAHIDSGKTTLTERMLFYTNRIHQIHEVRGKDGVGATMDSMELERERGITIQSAATHVEWKKHWINIIDTPGHVDFTIEVERALRVLDGAVLVLCGVGGVQSQSITVDRQMRRYKVPRIAFVNKLDRMGADPEKVAQQMRDKLNLNAVLMQIPLGLESAFSGIIDLVTMQAIYFDGDHGEKLRVEEIPADKLAEARKKRDLLIDRASLFSDELAEAYLEDRVTEALIHEAVRRGTLSLELTPVFIGSAFKNRGVQPLLDAVIRYLPNPTDISNSALDLENAEQEIVVQGDPDKPTILLAFKLDDSRFGQLTYVRIYQGRIKKGDELLNVRSGKKVRVGRLIRMHADEMVDIEDAIAGDIVALFGIECASGDTFTSGERISMSSMFVPTPVISLSIKAEDNKSNENMAKALNRFGKEDPTFQSGIDPETSETIIRGMGELHLEVYVERMRREYNINLTTGAPQVAYRESISQSVSFNYTHKKQTGGAGQFARIAGIVTPKPEIDFEFVDEIKGGAIPTEFIPSCKKGFERALEKGPIVGFPIVGVQITINDGLHHPVDSSDMAFQTAAFSAFREVYGRCKPIILEPIMRVAVEGPSEFQGNMIATLNQRRGVILSATDDNAFTVVEAEVPLSEMFGYSTVIRSATQGKAEFTMEFARYSKVPESIAEKLKKEYSENNKK
ncbi:MAG TPA: elongation factor G [bacterium]|nr:elongation factor G [bacterium]HNT64617.1 elongation factor G [bacterium]HOX85495.1 elongation factor G [bacterium]HPG44654.1 elongation factor G [bacterium]HPM97212.1 elongation factor G [bacterium]